MAYTRENLDEMRRDEAALASGDPARVEELRRRATMSLGRVINREEVEQAEERAKLWELYKIALPLAQADLSSEGFCDEAMTLAHRFLARWKAETEAPDDAKFRREMEMEGLRGEVDYLPSRPIDPNLLEASARVKP